MRISDWSSDVCSSDLVVGRHQADDVLVAALFENVDPHMSVEEPVSFLFPGQAHDDGRLDDADFADGGSDLAVLDRPPHWFGHGAQKRSEEHTSELQSLMRISYAVFCLKNKNYNHTANH